MSRLTTPCSITQCGGTAKSPVDRKQLLISERPKGGSELSCSISFINKQQGNRHQISSLVGNDRAAFSPTSRLIFVYILWCCSTSWLMGIRHANWIQSLSWRLPVCRVIGWTLLDSVLTERCHWSLDLARSTDTRTSGWDCYLLAMIPIDIVS